MRISSSSGRANYGVDAPLVVLWLFIVAVGAVLLGIVAALSVAGRAPQLGPPLFLTGLFTGISCMGTAAVMVFGSMVLKLRFRDKLLDGLRLRGDESVLDVGCGRGLLLIGAARRLKRGKAVGVDLWQEQDQTGNHPQRTMSNAKAENVAERVEVKTADMRELPFPDGSFDVVVSSWAIHNVYNAEGRKLAIREIVRVLKPSGQLAIADIRHVAEYVEALTEFGMKEVRYSRPYFLFVVPTRIVSASKDPG